MKKKTRLNLTETQTCHPELVSGSHQQTKEKEILKGVQPNSIFNDPCFRMTECSSKKKAAFTLAETLITLTVIGIIAMITVPAIISKHTESANRTKVKKAMSVYDTAVNKMVIENGIKNNEALVSTAGNLDNNCAGSSPYFKISQGSGCEFKTSDGLWWNIEDITHPIVAFKQADLTAEKAAGDNKDAFYFVGRIDETTGILRVNDYIAESGDNKGYLTKLYNFAKPEVGGAGGGNEPQTLASCTEFPCEVYGLSWSQFTIGEGDGITMIESDWGEPLCSWDPDEKTCTATNSVTSEGPLYISEPLTITEEDAKKYCDKSRDKSWCESEGDPWIAATMKCKEAGGRLPTGAELKVMNSKVQLDSKSNYWAAEANPDDNNLSFVFDTGIEEVYDNHLLNPYEVKAVCVGN